MIVLFLIALLQINSVIGDGEGGSPESTGRFGAFGPFSGPYLDHLKNNFSLYNLFRFPNLTSLVSPSDDESEQSEDYDYAKDALSDQFKIADLIDESEDFYTQPARLGYSYNRLRRHRRFTDKMIANANGAFDYFNGHYKRLQKSFGEDVSEEKPRTKRQAYNVFENVIRGLVYGNYYENQGGYSPRYNSVRYSPSYYSSADNRPSNYGYGGA